MGKDNTTFDDIFAIDPADPPALIDALLDRLHENDPDDLNETESTFVLLAEFEHQMRNGGMSEWFYEQGYNAQDLLHWLDELQAAGPAMLVRRGMSPFPGGVAPRDEGELELALQNLSDGEEEIWEELDQEYAEDHIGELQKVLVSLCLENQSEFG